MRSVAKFTAPRRSHRARLRLEELESRTVLSVVYAPAQIRTAYGFDQVSQTGASQTIAIVDAYNDPYILSNVNTFSNTFGLPTLSKGTTFKQVNQSGGTRLPYGNVGWGVEISLDVEWAHAVAPAANILLVEASSNSFSNLLTAVDYASKHANVVSMSWGGGEPSNLTSLDSHFQASGVTYVASSGDNGAGASWPASSAYVLGVGGTTLNLAADNTISSETGWSGSGGGPSAVEPEPSYQTTVQSSGVRTTPDVAYNADPNTGYYVYDTYGEPGWGEVGGTSAGAPQVAGLVALADQARGSTGPGSAKSLSGATQVLPTLYSSTSALNDITSGSNGQYNAGPGYDQVTGLGSPKAPAVINALKAASTTPVTFAAAHTTTTTPSTTTTHHNNVPTTPADVGFTAVPGGSSTSTQTLLTSGAFTQPQVFVGTLPGALPLATPVSTNVSLPVFVYGPVTQSVSIVGGEDSVVDNGTGDTNVPQAPAPGAVRPAVDAPQNPAPGAGQGLRRGVEGNENIPPMPDESEQAEEVALLGALIDSRSALAGLALALGGYWAMPEADAEARKRAWEKAWN